MRKLLTIFAVAALVLAFGSTTMAATWSVPGDFSTIQAAIDSSLVLVGDRIMVEPGEHAGALLDKSVEIKGEGGAIINDGPAHGSGQIQGFRLLAGSSGATISHLTFDGVDLAIMNGAAINDVTITQCTFNNTVQAISNWTGSGWEISHNVINDLRTRNGGGIGILVADWSANPAGVTNNVVSHNKISGTLHVFSDDGGGYDGSGIVIYADFRYSGADHISNNRIVKNKISMTSDTPEVVNINAFELTDTRATPDCLVIFHNAIGFNDFRGTESQMLITPPLEDCNKISRNLGDNRGHGLDPSVFGPGGN